MSDDKILLNQINIVARDFAATREFYRRLGVDFPDGPSSGEIQHAEVTLPNGVVLELDNEHLASIYNAAWRGTSSSRALIGFSVSTREGVDEKYAELTAAGYRGKQPPYDTFWGARYAVLCDPDGNDVGLMSPLDPERRRWPPVVSPAP
jgi:predicted lactoylglutathione lyase